MIISNLKIVRILSEKDSDAGKIAKKFLNGKALTADERRIMEDGMDEAKNEYLKS